MKDIRLAIEANPDKVFTRAGDPVEITDTHAGPRGYHIRGVVIRGDKLVSHWWHRDGHFNTLRKPSPIDLIIKA